MQKIKIGFIGAGGIARSHAFALDSLKYFYDDAPEFDLYAVASAKEESRSAFAAKYGFEYSLSLEEFLSHDIDTVFILGPNNVHYPHLRSVMDVSSVRRIYLEKPVCSSLEEELLIHELAGRTNEEVRIQVGYQFLFSSAIREALAFLAENDFGKTLHFSFTLKHGDYLNKSYRDKRRTRLTPAPDGGAMADLGSHAISLMVAFLGNDLQVISAVQSGVYPDVPAGSDLYSEISVYDPGSGAVGNVSASRVSAGTGDLLAFEIYAERGSLRYSSFYPDRFEYYFEKDGDWTTRFTGSHYKPFTSFPSGHVPGGWLRALIHAHYNFLTGKEKPAIVPDLVHGLEVQRLVRETASRLESFRRSR